MSKTKKALLIAALAAFSAPVHAQTAGPLAPAEGIVIQTTGEVRVKPDLATVHAGVGDALRQAFRMDGHIRSLRPFEELLRQLD